MAVINAINNLSSVFESSTTITAGTGITCTTGAIVASDGNVTSSASMLAVTFDTDVVAAALTMTATTISAVGTDTDIDINITAKNAGQVIINDLQLTTDLDVTYGGTGAGSFTDFGIILGSGTGALSVTAVGATGEIIIGNTGADPTWLTAGDDTFILTAKGAGVLPAWEAAAAAGVTSLTGDSGGALTGALDIAGGTNITTVASDPNITVNLDATISALDGVELAAGGHIGTAQSAGNTALIQAYDVDGTAYVTFATLTANNTPTMDLDDAVTKGTKYIYRAEGTDVVVADGGTGVGSLTDHGLILGQGTDAVVVLANATDGQLPIGSTGNDPVLAVITPGEGITIDNAAGSITINSTGAIKWNVVTGTSDTAVVNNGYICNNAGLVTITLPDTAAVGSIVRVTGMGAGGWKLAQNANDIVHFGTATTTTGAGGSLASTEVRDTVELVCVVEDTEWNVISPVGNITHA